MAVERPLEFFNPLNYNRTYCLLAKAFRVFFFFLFLLLASVFLLVEGAVTIMSIFPREAACVRGFVGQIKRERNGGWV